MDIVLVPAAAFLASGLTLFSGFGLGTLLLPAFALFMPIEVAVIATALVHGANSLLKAALLGRHADPRVLARFGLPAMAAALLGAWLLGRLSGFELLATWQVLGATATITPLKLVMGVLMAAFAVFELHPRYSQVEFDPRLLPVGGLLSGFFGGLSGHQGALRSAFLAKTRIEPRAFVGTNALIGFLVDLTRLSVYAALLTRGGPLQALLPQRERTLVAAGALAAFAGVLVGRRFLHQITMRSVQRLTGGLLLLIAALLAVGLV